MDDPLKQTPACELDRDNRLNKIERTPPVTDRDREHAELALDHISRLRDLGRFAARDTRQAEINFIAMLLRNERHGLT